jgi:signal transduction histidine kinase
LTTRDKLWIVLLASLVLGQTAVSLVVPRGDTLAIASDLIQGALLLLATAAFVPNVFRSHWPSRRTRLFWILMSAGMLLWLVYQAMWNYFEVVRRVDVPNPFVGDVVLFLHLVPMIAALAVRPHRRPERSARLGTFDFTLLLTWWVFLWVYTVIPWQYVHFSEAVYSNNFNSLYLTEKLVLLVGLGFLAYRSLGGWRRLYAQLLGASALYASSSYVANWAIGRQIYYSGSVYDIPLTVSIAWLAILGKFARRYPLTESEGGSQSMLGVSITRFAMLAVFSLPWFALRSLVNAAAPAGVHRFRIALCLLTMVVMGAMVLWRQKLLGAELASLLESSRCSLRDLKALQGQLIHSEKLASLGRLVGGAAHEINNPLTAMMGYSDLLSASALPPPEKRLAAQIRDQVRTTRTLVASLLTFARPTPAKMSELDLNSILQTALRVLQPQLEAQTISNHTELGAPLPPVLADPNQILHVCLHLAGQTGSRLNPRASRALYVQTRAEKDTVVLEFSRVAPAAANSGWTLLNAGSETGPATLSLSACRKIVEEHGGRILWRRSADDSLAFRLEMPAATAASKAWANGAAGVTRAAAVTSGS